MNIRFFAQLGILFVALFLSSALSAHAGWMKVYDEGGAFRAVDFIQVGSELRGLAVGSDGRILRSSDGGTTWNTVWTKDFATMYGVTFANATEAYAVGEKQEDTYLLRSADGGETWHEIGPGLDAGNFTDVDFLDSSTGVIVGSGGRILRTTTGGETRENWIQRESPTTRALYGVAFNDGEGTRAWAVGALGTVIRSDDSGATWALRDSGTTATLYDVHFANVVFGLTVGSGGVIRRSFDGGFSWEACTSGTTSTLYKVFMIDVNKAWAVGSTGTVLYTDDATSGCRWEVVSSGTTTTLRGSDFLDEHTGWMVGSGGEIHRFDDEAPAAPTGLVVTSSGGDPTPTFQWNAATDNVAIDRYRVSTDGITFISIGNTLAYTVVDPLPVGGYSFRVHALDAAGNVGVAATILFEVLPDTTPPGIPINLTLTSAISDPTPTFIWGVPLDEGGVVGYRARMAATDPTVGEVFPWSEVGNVLTFTLPVELALTVEPLTTYTFYLQALDLAGNASASAIVSFSSPFDPGDGGADEPETPVDEPDTPVDFLPGDLMIGDLIKLADDGNVETFGDSAVFYIGADGNRYVFPNDKTYFTWYSDFSTIRTISTTEMAALPLRGNVTYRPGVKMVKLQTNPTVYTVSRGGMLHAVPSEIVASALYGTNWNQQIDDVNDAFWFNYNESDALEDASDYSVLGARASATTINIDFGLTDAIPIP